MAIIIWLLLLLVLGPLMGMVCGSLCRPAVGRVLIWPCVVIAALPNVVELWHSPAAWPWLVGLSIIDVLLVVVPYRIFRWAKMPSDRT